METKGTRLEQLERDIDRIQPVLDTLTERLSEKGVLQQAETTDTSITNDSPPIKTIPTNLDKSQLKARIDSERKKLEKTEAGRSSAIR